MKIMENNCTILQKSPHGVSEFYEKAKINLYERAGRKI